MWWEELYFSIKKSERLEYKDWGRVILTILSPDKCINREDHFSYIKKFSGFSLDVHVYKYESTLYVRSVKKNGNLSAV